MKRAIFTIIILFTIQLMFAQNQTGNIEGTVITTDAKAVEGANVTIKELNKHTTTNANGSFSFKKIPFGTYTVIYSFASAGSKQVQVTVPPVSDATTRYELPLNAKELSEVIVTGNASLNSGVTDIGKSHIPIRDLPQAVTIISEADISNLQAQRLSDIIKNVNGVYLGSSRGSVQETFWARGYNISTNNMFKNGFRINNGALPEISGFESVEFLKGNAALLYGNVAPGGIVNMVTKKPKFEFGGEVSMRVGSFDLYKPSIDIYGPVSDAVGYRLNGTYEKANSFRDDVHSTKFYINPSLLFKLGNKTNLLLQSDYLQHDFTPDFGIGTVGNTKTVIGYIPDVPRSRFMGAPWQYAHTKQTAVSAELNHHFNGQWQLNTGISYQNYSRDYYALERIQADPSGKWLRPLGKFKNSEDYYIAQANLDGNFNTGFVSHKLLAGVDAEKYTQINYTADVNGKTYDSINVLDPDMYVRRTDIPEAQWVTRATIPVTRFGAFFQDLISISEKVKVLAGLRWSFVQATGTKTADFKKGTVTTGETQVDKAFSPKLGIVYQPVTNTSLFASYSNSFAPNSGQDINGDLLPPSIIDQLEAGIKQDWLYGKLSTNFTVYHILNNNFAVATTLVAHDGTDSTNSNVKELAGETRSKGFEIDIKGHPAKGLDVIAGYSYNDMRFTKTNDNAANTVEGQRVVNTPWHTANLTTFYTVQDGSLKGLKFGAGYYYTGDRLGGWNTPTATIKDRTFFVKDYSTLDVTAGYTFKKISLLAKLSNVTNTYNYTVHENYSINPIPPRNLVVTAALKF